MGPFSTKLHTHYFCIVRGQVFVGSGKVGGGSGVPDDRIGAVAELFNL